MGKKIVKYAHRKNVNYTHQNVNSGPSGFRSDMQKELGAWKSSHPFFQGKAEQTDSKKK